MEKRYTDLLTGLLNMAEAMLVCGSEISRVEDTVTRMGLAYGAVDMNVFVITSCIIDSVQAKVNFDTTGTITTDLGYEFPSKNELGDGYGMVAWGGAKAEWDAQAASFAAYVTGKTASEVAGIAINEATKPADGSDLSNSVTISIGGFQALIAKAFA